MKIFKFDLENSSLMSSKKYATFYMMSATALIHNTPKIDSEPKNNEREIEF